MKRTKTSDAQKRASVKYISEKRDRLTLSAPKGARDRWREAASAAGLTLNAWGLRALDAAAAAREMARASRNGNGKPGPRRRPARQPRRIASATTKAPDHISPPRLAIPIIIRARAVQPLTVHYTIVKQDSGKAGQTAKDRDRIKGTKPKRKTASKAEREGMK